MQICWRFIFCLELVLAVIYPTSSRAEPFVAHEYIGQALVTQKVVDFDLPQVTLNPLAPYSKMTLDEGKFLLDKTKKIFLFEISGYTKAHYRLWLDQKNVPIKETGYFSIKVPIQLGDSTFKLDVLDSAKQRRTQLEFIVTLIDYQILTEQNSKLLLLSGTDETNKGVSADGKQVVQNLQIDQINKSGLLTSFEVGTGFLQLDSGGASSGTPTNSLPVQSLTWHNTYFSQNLGVHARFLKGVFLPINNPLADLSLIQVGINYRGLAANDSRQNFQFCLGSHMSGITLGQNYKWEINGLHVGGLLNYPLSKKWWTDLQADVAFSLMPFFMNHKINITWTSSFVFQSLVVANIGLQWENWSGFNSAANSGLSSSAVANDVKWSASYIGVVFSAKIKLG